MIFLLFDNIKYETTAEIISAIKTTNHPNWSSRPVIIINKKIRRINKFASIILLKVDNWGLEDIPDNQNTTVNPRNNSPIIVELIIILFRRGGWCNLNITVSGIIRLTIPAKRQIIESMIYNLLSFTQHLTYWWNMEVQAKWTLRNYLMYEYIN